MNSIENAIVIPLVIVIIVTFLVISIKNVTITGKQIKNYSAEEKSAISDCDVIRISEVMYDEIEELRR